MIGKFFHTPKARKFDIPYRFYDPDKEAMDDREERIRRELGMEPKRGWEPGYRPNIRGQFRRAQGASVTQKNAQRSANIRLIILIALLSLLFYFFLNF